MKILSRSQALIALGEYNPGGIVALAESHEEMRRLVKNLLMELREPTQKNKDLLELAQLVVGEGEI